MKEGRDPILFSCCAGEGILAGVFLPGRSKTNGI